MPQLPMNDGHFDRRGDRLRTGHRCNPSTRESGSRKGRMLKASSKKVALWPDNPPLLIQAEKKPTAIARRSVQKVTNSAAWRRCAERSRHRKSQAALTQAPA